jgi:hypothetical protein
MDLPNDEVGLNSTSGCFDALVAVTCGSPSRHNVPTSGSVSADPSCRNHQFAGGSLAGNDWSPHSSTMSHVRRVADLAVVGPVVAGNSVSTWGHGLVFFPMTSASPSRSDAIGCSTLPAIAGVAGGITSTGTNFTWTSLRRGVRVRIPAHWETRFAPRCSPRGSDWPTPDPGSRGRVGEHPSRSLPVHGNGNLATSTATDEPSRPNRRPA